MAAEEDLGRRGQGDTVTRGHGNETRGIEISPFPCPPFSPSPCPSSSSSPSTPSFPSRFAILMKHEELSALEVSFNQLIETLL
ncbi:MAG: hypothetical protein ACREPR_20695, partial [Brasilonema sp.]